MELKKIGMSEASSWNRMYVEKLEKELKNCHQEIEYLQDQLNLRNFDARFMADNVQSLELKLAGAENLNDELKLVSEELKRADSQCLILVRELKHKEEELRKSDLHIENLEALVLDSQCETESLKLDITALDQRYGEAERLIQQLAEEKDRMTKQLDIFKNQLQEKQQVISTLENERNLLQDRLIFDRNAKQSFLDIEIDIVKKLAAVTSPDEHMNNEMEKMARQVHDSELLVMQLKEELKAVKFKAKEEAEDLTQAMAELRYQFTIMLEEESKRRALVEEASIRRVQDLEAQVKNEQKKYITALSRFEKANELAEEKSLEIMKLKRALENLHLGTNLGSSSQRNRSCACGYCSIKPIALDIEARVDVEALDAICAKKELNHALTECYHDEASTHDVQKDKKITTKDFK